MLLNYALVVLTNHGPETTCKKKVSSAWASRTTAQWAKHFPPGLMTRVLEFNPWNAHGGRTD